MIICACFSVLANMIFQYYIMYLILVYFFDILTHALRPNARELKLEKQPENFTSRSYFTWVHVYPFFVQDYIIGFSDLKSFVF